MSHRRGLRRHDRKATAGARHDALLQSYRGGRAAAVPRPLHGGERIAQTLAGFFRQVDWAPYR